MGPGNLGSSKAFRPVPSNWKTIRTVRPRNNISLSPVLLDPLPAPAATGQQASIAVPARLRPPAIAGAAAAIVAITVRRSPLNPDINVREPAAPAAIIHEHSPACAGAAGSIRRRHRHSRHTAAHPYPAAVVAVQPSAVPAVPQWLSAGQPGRQAAWRYTPAPPY